jgi:hypothetical protein
MTRLVRQAFRAGALVALLVSLGCADTVPTGSLAQPEAEALLTESGAMVALERLASFETPRVLNTVVGHRNIGPEGGRLEVHGFAVVVPAGAVREVTRFSIRLPTGQSPERVVAVFGPHGTQFATPVTLEFPLAGTSVAGSPSAAVVWWDGTDWVEIGGTPTPDGARLRATTDHFSTYGTTDEGRGGGTLVSGG